MNRVMWFDIPVSDVNKGAAFYSDVFGWNVLPLDDMDAQDDLSFRIAQTDTSDAPDRPNRPGAINGGIVTRSIGIMQPTILIEVDDIAQKIEEVMAAGGSKVTDKKALPLAYGHFAYVRDPEGNVIGLWEWMSDRVPAEA